MEETEPKLQEPKEITREQFFIGMNNLKGLYQEQIVDAQINLMKIATNIQKVEEADEIGLLTKFYFEEESGAFLIECKEKGQAGFQRR